jgi:DEAD/DEAH box helicase domain-containing protein
VLVTSDDPVDQYLALHPDYFFGGTPEHGRIDPDNLRILADHVRCAAYELPIQTDEAWGDLSVDETQEVLQYLAEEGGLLVLGPDGWRMSGEDYPAAEISLRDMYDENVVIIDVTQKPEKILGEIDFFDAHVTVYENAIYQHHAQLYEVQRFDWHERKAYVRAAEVDYYTTAIDQTKVFVLDVEDETPARVDHGWGDVRIITRFVGYKKLRFKTSENIGYGPIKLPDIERHTTSYWATFASEQLENLKLDQEALSGAMSGIGRVMHTVAIVHLMCATGDLHVTVGSGLRDSRVPQPTPSGEARPTAADARIGNTAELIPLASGSAIDDPTIYLYDSMPGGVGFSEKLFSLHDSLLARSLALVQDCPCDHGCPACVGPPQLVSPRGKAAAIRILQSVNS